MWHVFWIVHWPGSQMDQSLSFESSDFWFLYRYYQIIIFTYKSQVVHSNFEVKHCLFYHYLLSLNNIAFIHLCHGDNLFPELTISFHCCSILHLLNYIPVALFMLIRIGLVLSFLLLTTIYVFLYNSLMMYVHILQVTPLLCNIPNQAFVESIKSI